MSRLLRHLLIGALIALCSLLQLHLLRMASPSLLDNLAYASKMEWAGYHSRLLGFWLIRLCGGNYPVAIWIGLMLGGLLSWRLGGILGLVMYHACFGVWASPWFQPWDILEPVTFIAFVLLVVEKARIGWIVALFAIAIFNLQSAMFIALWMLLSRHLIAGVSCTIFGIVVMWVLQHGNQPRFGIHHFQGLDGWSQCYTSDYAQSWVTENLRELTGVRGSVNWMALGVVLTIVATIIVVMHEQFALALTFAALLGATIVFGIVNEMRVYLPFVPLLILGAKSLP